MDRQIVDPNPGLNYDAVTRTSKWKKKYVHRSRPTPNCNAKLYSSFAQKSWPFVIKYE